MKVLVVSDVLIVFVREHSHVQLDLSPWLRDRERTLSRFLLGRLLCWLLGHFLRGALGWLVSSWFLSGLLRLILCLFLLALLAKLGRLVALNAESEVVVIVVLQCLNLLTLLVVAAELFDARGSFGLLVFELSVHPTSKVVLNDLKAVEVPLRPPAAKLLLVNSDALADVAVLGCMLLLAPRLLSKELGAIVLDDIFVLGKYPDHAIDRNLARVFLLQDLVVYCRRRGR